MPPDIYSYIKTEEAKFETDEIQVGDNWYWNFRKHVQMIFHLKNGVFFTGDNNWMRAFKNIMEPILNLAYWTEDIEVKDVVFFIENSTGKVLSFLLKKYHDEVYTRENDLDVLFDEITETDLDYGGVLVQEGMNRPEVLPLNAIAFCDQTDALGGAIAFKHYFTPSKLRSMSKLGWGLESNGATISIEDLCVLATAQKDAIGTLNDNQNEVPSKAIEVYIVIGGLPEAYLEDNDNMEYYTDQRQVVAFYQDKEGKKQGVTLYRKEDKEGSIKFFTSRKVYQRALGRGVGETLLHPQIWTNFLEIHKMGMLESGAKTPLWTDDPEFTQKQKIQEMENLEVMQLGEGKKIGLVPTVAPNNIQLYSNEINVLYEYAQTAGSANDPIMGKEAASGTTFRGQERSVAQGRGIHDRRRGQRAKFIEEIYRDWIIPKMVREITKGKKFLATLSTDELSWVADTIATNKTNERIKEMIFAGKKPTEKDKQTFMQLFKGEFLKKGNKQLLEVLKGEFDDIEVKMGINIAGKQKNLADLSDKVLSIFQFVLANPQGFQSAMQIPALAKAFENLLEYSNLSIGDFSSLLTPPAQPVPVDGQEQGQEAPQLSLNQPTA